MNVMIRTILLAAVMVACGLAPCAAQSQDPKAKALPGSPDQVKNLNNEVRAIGDDIRKTKAIRVLPLKYANAPSAAKTISDTFKHSARYQIGGNNVMEDLRPVQVTADERTNSLIVMATEADFVGVKMLVTELDQPLPKSTAEDVLRPRILQLKSSPDKALELALKLLQENGSAGPYAIDSIRRQIMILAPDPTAKIMEDYIARWDVAPPAAAAPPVGDVQIRVVWISSDEQISASRPLPDDLKPLIPAFKKIGLDKPFAAATYTMTTTPNAEFSTVGATYGLSASIRIAGQYNDRKASPNLSISIREVTQDDRSIDINSELTAPLGHLIVLGATTVGAGQQQMAFVVQVSRPDSINPAAKP